MKCPIDDTVLIMSDRNDIEIDYCGACRGVWLDRGELDKLIERSSNTTAYENPNHSSQPQQYTSHNQRPRKKKRESFLGDMFDF